MPYPDALAPLVDQVLAANAANTDEYRAGKTGLLGFFVGQVMRQSGGSANPALGTQLCTSGWGFGRLTVRWYEIGRQMVMRRLKGRVRLTVDDVRSFPQ